MLHLTTIPVSRAHRAHRALLASLIAIAAVTPLHAQGPGSVQQQASGPVITAAGPSFIVEEPTFATPARMEMKALFEINVGGPDTVKVNEQMVTMARFFNIHARNGVAESRLKAAAVFHGSGWTALLSDAAFAARFGGKPNPSRALVEELLQHGAQLVLCGQTMGARSVKRDELLPGVKVSTSAMTAMLTLQNDGYRFIPW
ncbi:MAG: DsrE family protein [Gemmatimonadota bacterium]